MKKPAIILSIFAAVFAAYLLGSAQGVKDVKRATSEAPTNPTEGKATSEVGQIAKLQAELEVEKQKARRLESEIEQLEVEKHKARRLESEIEQLKATLIVSNKNAEILQKSISAISSVAVLSPTGKELSVPEGVYIPTDGKFLLNPREITGGKVSVPNGPQSRISFTNRTDEDLYLFWVDYSGRPTFSAKLRPGEEHSGISSEGQVHVVTRTNGDVYGYVSPLAGSDDIDIEK